MSYQALRLNATGLHTFVYTPIARHKKRFCFLKDHQFKNQIFIKVIKNILLL